MSAFRSLSRREFLPAFASLLAATTAGVGAAGAQEIGGQAEWKQSYDAATNLRVARSTTPVLSPMTLQSTEQMVDTYRRLASAGGFPP